MYFHSQDLRNEDKKWHLVHWRCWIGNKPQVKFYISIPSEFWHLKLRLCENGWQEEAIGFSVATPLFFISIGLNSWKLYSLLEKVTKRKDQTYTHGRDVGIAFHNGTFWFDLWNDPMESRARDPRWWHFSFNLMDFLFGKAKYTEVVKQEGEVKIDMPEGVYDSTFKRFVSFWKRPRSPFTKKIERVTIEVPVGIPHEGKGENSWDMGMDATFASTFPVYRSESIYDIAKRFAMSCLKERQKYGNLHSPEYATWKVQGEMKQEHGKIKN